MEGQSQAKVVLRWVAFFPAAVIAAWLAWVLVSLLNRITMGMQGIDTNAFLSRAFIEFMSAACMGAAFVFVSAKVAPGHRKIVAYGMAGVALVAAGFALFPALLSANYWAVWSGISLIVGVGVTAYAVSTGELVIEP